MTENVDASGLEATPDRKRAIIAGGVAAALVLGLGGYKLMSGGGSNDSSALGPVPHARSSAAASAQRPAKPAKAAPAKFVPSVTRVPLGRDPFLALYTAPVVIPAVASASTPTGSSTGTATGTSTGTAPATSTGSSTGTAPGKPPATTGSSTPTAPVATTYPVQLVRIYGSGNDLTAVFSVKGKTQTAKGGSVFGATQELKLLSVRTDAKGGTAVIQVGDADPFDALAGKSYYVM